MHKLSLYASALRVDLSNLIRHIRIRSELRREDGPRRLWAVTLKFVRVNLVFVIALIAAIVTSFLVPPDAVYLGYFDFRTLTCLFCTLGVVGALTDVGFFYFLAQSIVKRFRTLRSAAVALVCITFLGSMLIANDMALLTFLPLGYTVLHETKNEDRMAFVFIMQNIAANLGGMLTPFGNPQNLFLYSRFSIPTGEFTSIMLPPFLIAVFLILLCTVVFTPSVPLVLTGDLKRPEKVRTGVYLALFAFSIVIVFRIIPYWLGLIVIPAVLFFMDRKALAHLDYPLLGTFSAFFVFAGNMGRLDAVRNVVGGLLAKNVMIVSALSCQFISNVPSAILLSQFTEDYASLLVGVNVGGCGTLIASLASLITFRSFLCNRPHDGKRYFALFSVINFGFLIFLLAVMSFLR